MCEVEKIVGGLPCLVDERDERMNEGRYGPGIAPIELIVGGKSSPSPRHLELLSCICSV